MESYEKAISYLPERLKDALNKYKYRSDINEIRLRKNSPMMICVNDENIFINNNGEKCVFSYGITATPNEIQNCVKAFCSGSVYRFLSTVNDGYITNDDGFRMGICPDSNTSNHYLPEYYSGISIRIPRIISGASSPLIKRYKENGIISTLIISKPGIGKTTLIRDLAIRLSKGEVSSPKRCVIIDERKEIFPDSISEIKGICDIISGYPKDKAIEIATRVFAPEIIICDEIINSSDAEAIISSLGSGIIHIATAHADSFESLAKKPILSKLIQSNAFDLCLLLKRKNTKTYSAEYEFTKL